MKNIVLLDKREFNQIKTKHILIMNQEITEQRPSGPLCAQYLN